MLFQILGWTLAVAQPVVAILGLWHTRDKA